MDEYRLYSWERFGGYEISSKGDTRLSAMFAKMPDGRTLECHYQCDVKLTDPGGTRWWLGKGKPPNRKISTTELYLEYKDLWRIWTQNNLELFAQIAELVLDKHEGVLSDRFATTPINQARVISELMNEYFCGVGHDD